MTRGYETRTADERTGWVSAPRPLRLVPPPAPTGWWRACQTAGVWFLVGVFSLVASVAIASAFVAVLKFALRAAVALW